MACTPDCVVRLFTVAALFVVVAPCCRSASMKALALALPLQLLVRMRLGGCDGWQCFWDGT